MLAASQAQAQVVFRYALGFLEASPVLRREIASTTMSEIRLRNGAVIAVHANSYRTVRGKTGILFKVASAVTEAPDGVVREVIFPVVDERTFHALVKEALAAGTTPARRVHTAVRASYGSYYRRMMPKLLAALDFRDPVF